MVFTIHATVFRVLSVNLWPLAAILRRQCFIRAHKKNRRMHNFFFFVAGVCLWPLAAIIWRFWNIRAKKKKNFSRDCLFSCVIFFLVVVALGLRFCAFLQKPREPKCKPGHRKLVATNSTNWVRWVCAFARFCRNHENQNANPGTESLSPPIVLIACVGLAFSRVC